MPEQVHFLRADLDFPARVSASAELAFGGQNRDRTQAELTAVPVLSEKKKLPSEKEMEGWFLASPSDVSTPPAFEMAARKLVTFVEKGHVVWVEGVHLPQSIALPPKAAGVTLVR